MDNNAIVVVRDALQMLQQHPRKLEIALEFFDDQNPPSIVDLVECFPDSTPQVVEAFRRTLAALDAATPGNSWTNSTQPNSRERRDRIYQCFQIQKTLIDALEATCPFLPIEQAGETLVIAPEHIEWYTANRRADHDFYWSRYRSYLINKGFELEAVQQVDDDTTEIVGRLSDPLSVEPYRSRGLVVGYVQSGKTTNFTGLIAKSIDAGYRLIIVLAGTLNVLRSQTQRRLDMELVGKENITDAFGGGDHDYVNDRDWDLKFVEYGALPHTLGGSDIIRLTDYHGDFKDLQNGINALRVERRDRSKPIYDEANLFHSSTRVIICKKNSAVLKKVFKDLKRAKDNLVEVPTLIIDDESDQASINTVRPKTMSKRDEVERTSINKRIVEILGLLPRAQYVGYTATPVANVFINPDDPQDLFPGDFIISLKEPVEYFGASKFHDLDRPLSKSVKDSNDAAFVENITSEIDEDDGEIRKALDLYLLSGAIKLFRESMGTSGDFTHHTMLMHMSHLQIEHIGIRDRIVELWDTNQYRTGGAYVRLGNLLEDNVRPVNTARAPDLPLPKIFEDLMPFIQLALERIDSDGGAVKMINGHEDADRLDFDKAPVWKIIVGGTKLSRGYTIEGLTVSYFRRTVGAQDSLLQMGRWFGYRKGYRDLPRLFIGRNEILKKATKNKPAVRIDLLEAFKGTCLAERAFRESLAKYAKPQVGENRITPREIAPIVELYFPDLPPVAKNRMWNAVVISENWGRRWIQPTYFSADDDVNGRNLERLSEMVRSAEGGFSVGDFEASGRFAFKAVTGIVGNEAFESFIKTFEFAMDSQRFFGAQLGFLTGKHGEHGIVDWLIVFPKLARARRTETVGQMAEQIDVIERSRRGDKKRINALAAPIHRKAVLPVSQSNSIPIVASGAVANLLSPTRGVVLVFLVTDINDAHSTTASITPAFELFPSGNSLPVRPKLQVLRVDQGDVIELDN